MKRIHLIDVSEPLTVYCGLQMRCGEILQNAEPKFMMAEDVACALSILRHAEFMTDEDLACAAMLVRNICRDCFTLPADRFPDTPYHVYGLVEKDFKSSEVKTERKEELP